MKQLLVATARVSAEDAVADAVLDYEYALIEQHRTARVVFPVFLNEGETYCELILGRGAIHGCLALPNTSDRRVAGSEHAVSDLKEQTRAIREEFSGPFEDDWYDESAHAD